MTGRCLKAGSAYCKAGCMRPVVEALCEQIARYAPQRTLLVDAGCGEGFYARSLAPLFEAVVAFDLAREGVALAASRRRAGACRLSGSRFDAHPRARRRGRRAAGRAHTGRYAEFARVLRVGGILIKVLPREGYLCQLRALAAKGAYSNRDVLARMDDACAGGFAPLVRRAVTYTRPLPAGTARRCGAHVAPLAPGSGV